MTLNVLSAAGSTGKTGVANPLGSVLTSGMMLDFLGWKTEAQAIRTAVRAALKENGVTPDLGGNKGTVEVGDWLAKFAENNAHTNSSRNT